MNTYSICFSTCAHMFSVHSFASFWYGTRQQTPMTTRYRCPPHRHQHTSTSTTFTTARERVRWTKTPAPVLHVINNQSVMSSVWRQRCRRTAAQQRRRCSACGFFGENWIIIKQLYVHWRLVLLRARVCARSVHKRRIQTSSELLGHVPEGKRTAV